LIKTIFKFSFPVTLTFDF